MKYLKLSKPDRDAVYRELESMPDFLADMFAGLSAEEAAFSPSDGTLAPVEQCWHLADLEREGFNQRIRRLLEDTNPWLEDFEGARLVRERQYKQRSLSEGIAAFREARLGNLSLIQAVTPEGWMRQGEQEGVGPVMLCDIPVMMSQHDASHRAEIAEWRRALNG